MGEIQKTILVTGASKGIGRAVCHRLLENEWKVVGLSRSIEQNGIDHPNFFPIECDFSSIEVLPSFLKDLSKRFFDIDGMISNVGVGRFGNIEEFSYQQIKELFDLNFLSHVYLLRTFLPLIKKRGKGDIVFIGSEAALSGKRKGAMYCASKFALRGFAQALRDECSTSGIRVSIINPGMVKTDFFKNLRFSPGEAREEHILPEDVAETVKFVLESPTGTVFDEINLSPQKHRIIQIKNS